MEAPRNPGKSKRTTGTAAISGQPAEKGFMQRFGTMILLAIVIAVTAVIYFPALQNSFTNWDDNDYVTENPVIRDLSAANIRHIFTRPIALNYHPLTMLSLALNYKFSGDEPYSYFLVNILLHLLNTVLTFYFTFLVLGRNKPLALFVAAIFAVHPMHVESVAWISERKDVLYAFFFLGGLIAWTKFSRKRSLSWYLLALVLFILSGLSKPSSVVFPLVLLLLDFLAKRKLSWMMMVEKVPFFVISAAIGIATLYAQVGKSVVDVQHFNLLQQFLFACYGFFIYMFKLLVPYGLSALHPVPVFNTSLDLPWIYFASPVLNAFIVILVIYSLKFTRTVAFGLLFYFLNIVLTLQFMQVGSAVIAERYTYISYIGLLVVLAWLLNLGSMKYKLPRRWLYLLMALFFGISTFIAGARVRVWKNSGTLWTDVIEKYPQSYTAYNNRGYFYVNEDRLEDALQDFTRSVELEPAFLDALNNRGSLYRLKNLPREAIEDYNRVIAADPNHVKALSGRGNAYATLGILDSALNDFNRAYELDPVTAVALGDRGSVYFRLGQFEKAIDDCSRKIQADPSNTSSYLNRGVSYSSLEKWDLAILDYSVVLAERPDNPAVYEWRGVAYRNTGSLEEAIDDFTRGIQLDHQKASLYINRGLAYKLAGRPALAAKDFETARQSGAAVPEE